MSFTPAAVGGLIGNAGLMAFRMAAEGDYVPGTGSKDTVPYLLTPGEYVNTKASVKKYGKNFFDALNGGSSMPIAMHPITNQQSNNNFQVSVPLSVSQMPNSVDTKALQADIEESVISVMRKHLR
jgi:hypothetical protein